MEAFPDGFSQGVKNVWQEFAQYAQENNWTTAFQFYLNNKRDYPNTSSLWTLEEQYTADDFRAGAWFMGLCRQGWEAAGTTDTNFHWRTDTSARWQQNWGQLKGICNLRVQGDGRDWDYRQDRYRRYTEQTEESRWWYGTGPDRRASLTEHGAQILKHWSHGLNGGTPYWDNFKNNWSTATGNDQDGQDATLSVLLSGDSVPGYGTFDGRIATVRMKAMRYGQQLCELLNLMAGKDDWNRNIMARTLSAAFGDSGDPSGDGDGHDTFGGDEYTNMEILDYYQLHADLVASLAAGVEVGKEAEDFDTRTGKFVVGDDPEASEEQYMWAPNGSGNRWNGPDAGQRLEYSFNVEQEGSYRIKGRVYAPNDNDDSFWVRVDGEPSGGYLWEVLQNTAYLPDYVSDRGGEDPVQVCLTAGTHTVSVYLREDGTRLDTIGLERTGSCQDGLEKEAEECDTRTGEFVVGDDPDASEEQYVWAPNGSGNEWNLNESHRVECSFNVEQEGSYRIKGRVYAPNDNDDSFWVRVDGEPSGGYLWEVLQNTAYLPDYVSDRDGQDPVQVCLTAGTHTVSVYLREDGTRLDTIGLERTGSCDVPPSIDVQPEDQTVTEGETATFDVTASGTEPLSYQWQRWNSGAWEDISGETSASYTILSASQLDDGARFRCMVTNAGGSVPSDECILTVIPLNSAIDLVKLPELQDVNFGEDVSFTLTVLNTGDVDLDNVIVTDALCDSLILEDDGDGDAILAPSEEWSYNCTVNNATADFSNTASVDGDDPTGFTVSDSATADVTVGPIDGLEKEAEECDTRTGEFVVGDDANASGGQYVWAPNGSGNEWNLNESHRVECSFNVEQEGSYRIKGRVYAPNDNDDSFWVRVDGEPSGGYLWDVLQNTAYLPDYVSDRDGQDPVQVCLTAGTHTVSVYLREDGTRLDTIGLERTGSCDVPPSIDVQPEDQTVTEGETATFDVTASGTEPLSYQWQRWNSGVWEDISGETSASYTILSASQLDDGARFRCMVTNAGGSVPSDECILTVIPLNSAIDLVKLPELQDVNFGEDVSFTLTVLNTGDVDLDNVIVTDALCDSLILEDDGDGDAILAPSEEWSYNCTVNNATADFSNTASVDGDDPTGFTVSDSATADVTVGPIDGLEKEAEDFDTRTGKFVVGDDPEASEEQYMWAPNGSGNRWNGPDAGQRLEYSFTVEQEGSYRIKGRVYAPNGNDDSFWVRVDGEPSGGYLWEVLQNTEYLPDYVSDRGGEDPVQVCLTAGTHTVSVYLREDGTRLDTIGLERTGSCQDGLEKEAEDFDTRTGKFVAGDDENASGEQYMWAPNGSGNRWNGPDAGQRLEYSFTVEQEGSYRIKGRVYAPNGNDDSFWVRVDGEPSGGYLWEVLQNTEYLPDYVSDRGGEDPVQVCLTAGTHTVSVYLREDGTRLDTIGLELARSGSCF